MNLSRSHARGAFLAVLLPFLAGADSKGCSPDESIGGNDGPVYPPNACAADSDGSRPCYSAADPSSVWLEDCERPIARDYFRVYAVSESSSYMIPRPDGTGLTFGICDGDDAALATLFAKYSLCDEFLDGPGVEKINAMPIADALAIAHALHERLRFEAVLAPSGSGVWAIAPFTFPDDLQAACPAAATTTGDSSLLKACDDYLGVVCGGTDIGVDLQIDEAQAQALATALNGYYGIDP